MDATDRRIVDLLRTNARLSYAELERLIVRLNRIRGVARTRTTVALSTKWEGRPRKLEP